ncbi:copper chaperone PCu(A)C [Sphingomonas sp.]|jgi:copper(I)-binding protein|uniref:copper chaperone PCu(A)C n=1 Tax=Sphingomonas sp. TaxID=28214 RepID=UPI0035C81197
MRRFATIAAVLLIAGCSQGVNTPAVGDAWVRLAAVPGRPAAAYAILHGGAKDAQLTQIASPGVARIELHTSRMTGNNMMAMDAVSGVPVARHGTAKLAPGGYHAMLFGVPATVTAGSTLPMTFRFDDGTVAQVNARVIAAGDAAPE